MLEINGAVEAEWPDEGVAAHYGDPAREQRAMTEGQVLVDRSNRGVVKVTGPDRLSWLHSLTSQDVERLAPGSTKEALILSPQGHLEHHLTLTDDGTATWIHVEPHTAKALVDYLNSMRFMLRVEVEDLTGVLVVQTLAGPLPAEGGVISRTEAADSVAATILEEAGAAAVMQNPFGIDLIVPGGGGQSWRRPSPSPACGPLRRRGSPRASRGQDSTPITRPCRTRSASSTPPCT